MKNITVGKFNIPVCSVGTAVVGAGAAGLNAAHCLAEMGQDVAIICESMASGTSRNTGSDKQTYYKLSLSGEDADSVRLMARDLFSGGAMDGDHALSEAALSAEGFIKLANLGVEFPRSRYGEFVGYKTDHDPKRRATSAGPYTSKRMVECLEAAVREKNVPIYEQLQAVRILTEGGKAMGVLAFNRKASELSEAFVLVLAGNVVLATGGPAGMYKRSVYPFGHHGSSGLAFEAGAAGKNLTEWQNGLASVCPRWNVSGTYMQCLPQIYSVDEEGNKYDFLAEGIPNRGERLSAVFMKGYQWPFEASRAQNGSSRIDMLVDGESAKGRKVYLDFRCDPDGALVDFAELSAEAREYLEAAGATMETPIARLKHMNAPAIDFYREHGVDLEKEPLEIALSVQHNNGGIDVDMWWQTRVRGLFAVGECAGTHGIRRPGGSALNSGQAGSKRAAQWIAAHPAEPLTELPEKCMDDIAELAALAETTIGAEGNAAEYIDAAQERMSRAASAVRKYEDIMSALAETEMPADVCAKSMAELGKVFRLREMLISQRVYLAAMAQYIEKGGVSRGGALYPDSEGTFADETQTQITELTEGEVRSYWRSVRPIPEDDLFFENVWRGFRENGNTF